MSHYSEEWLAERLAKSGKVKAAKTSPAVGPDSKRQVRASRRDYKAELLQQLALVGIKVEPEFYFAKPRKFRADWKVLDVPVLVEYDGGMFTKKQDGKADASHSSVGGILRDMEKFNLAQIHGYVVIRVNAKHIEDGRALQWIEAAVIRARVCAGRGGREG